MWDQFVYIKAHEANKMTPSCLVARSNETGKIVGSRFGVVKTRVQVQEESSFIDNLIKSAMTFLTNYCPSFVPIPKAIIDGGNLMNLMNSLSYGESNAFEELQCDKIYFAHHVCVDPEVRGRGLGSELVRRSHRLAEQAECSHTYILAAGTDSQKMFSKLGYKVLREMEYAKFARDQKGRPFLENIGDHKV